jgi:hypothetical protein
MSIHRHLLAFFVALVCAIVIASPASAGRVWCRQDPVFSVAGTQVNVDVAIWEEHVERVTGPVMVTLFVPEGVEAVLLWQEEGFNGFGEVVTIETSDRLRVTDRGVRIRVEVTVPASRNNTPVLVDVTTGGETVTVSGKANRSIPVTLLVQPAS